MRCQCKLCECLDGTQCYQRLQLLATGRSKGTEPDCMHNLCWTTLETAAQLVQHGCRGVCFACEWLSLQIPRQTHKSGHVCSRRPSDWHPA